MDNTGNNFTLYGERPVYQLFTSLVIILGGGIILMSVIVLAGTLIFRGDASTLLNNITSQGGDYNLPFLRYVVISQDISLFIIPGIIILNLMEKSGRLKLTNIQIPATNEIIIVIILAFCIFPITSFTGQINSGIHLPQWLSGVEQWMVEKEDKADNMIDLLVVSKTFWVMLLNLLTIAIIPAIGEEIDIPGCYSKNFDGSFQVRSSCYMDNFFLFQCHPFPVFWICSQVYTWARFWVSVFMERHSMATHNCTFSK